jgi:putative membrane protein
MLPKTLAAIVAWLESWRGVVLGAAILVATIWLAWNNKLVLYIHPRYIVFTVVMSAIALVFVVASFVTKRLDADDDNDHDHDHDHDAEVAAPESNSAARKFPTILALASFGLSAVFAVSLLVIPPSTLTSATVDQRAINSTGVGAEVQSLDAASVASNDVFSSFTVLDWASLLRQSSDASFYAGKPVDVVGFVTADPDDPENVFYVSRFIVTCCAVDAQPVGVPVYLPGWEDSFAIDQWVRVAGEFAQNPSRSSTQPLALRDSTITEVGEPAEPYLF